MLPGSPESKALPFNPRRVGLVTRAVVPNTKTAGPSRRSSNSTATSSPENDVEESMIEDMVSALWRMRRTWAVETGLRQPGNAG